MNVLHDFPLWYDSLPRPSFVVAHGTGTGNDCESRSLAERGQEISRPVVTLYSDFSRSDSRLPVTRVADIRDFPQHGRRETAPAEGEFQRECLPVQRPGEFLYRQPQAAVGQFDPCLDQRL